MVPEVKREPFITDVNGRQVLVLKYVYLADVPVMAVRRAPSPAPTSPCAPPLEPPRSPCARSRELEGPARAAPPACPMRPTAEPLRAPMPPLKFMDSGYLRSAFEDVRNIGANMVKSQ
ncbi:DNA-binding virion core protein [Nile crocodilepox virus]|uniref:DNA-binding virion core protein n=1 Tax=Nile crocodilepox virus (isolate Crocodylus niloticus/Zimbabwe/Ume/2001) TaxID=1289473 RepID=Q070J8_CPRVZ|nr:DNA-binding virion core protein [Nile crocodilepox virus]ABJ08944.1 DNA-binding virion core protein [Nile crocodilepox virus]